MDVFVFPSLFEGLPLVALEAQASGVYSVMADTISKEVKITDAVTFCHWIIMQKNGRSIFWNWEVLGERKFKMLIIKEQFQCAGYDIMTAGKQLLEIL